MVTFDEFESGEILTDDVPGLLFSSPNSEAFGYVAIHAFRYSYPVSGSNVLFGGFVPVVGLQIIRIDFDSPIDAFGFYLGTYDPGATDLEVVLEFADESTTSLFTGNDGDLEEENVFFGFTPDTPVVAVTLISGLDDSGVFEEFVVDNVMYVSSGEEEEDTTKPVCSGDPTETESGAAVEGTATDAGPGDSGIASVELLPGAVNLVLFVDPEFEPGASSVTFLAFPDEGGPDAEGTVLVTDLAGLECTLPVDFNAVGEGPLTEEVLCDGEGILLTVSNDSTTPAGTAICSAEVPSDDDPAFPAGYEPSPAGDLNPCRILTIESPISGETSMVYKKDGDFDSRLRLLFSRSDGGGLTFPPFTDITESVIPILTVIPDPTRLSGKKEWSPVKIACALQAELCDGLDNDGDGLVDEDLPVGGPEVDFDMDGAPLCAAGPAAADCNDQILAIHPGAAETCNGLDDDCDAGIDEDNPGGGADCAVAGETGLCAEGLTVCFEGALACEQVNVPVPEIACDGDDNDCDGETDELYLFSGYLPPVNPLGTSIFKRGRVVPLKFRLTDCAGALVGDAVATVSVFFYASGVVGTEIEEVSSRAMSNDGTAYRYDATSGQVHLQLEHAAAGFDDQLRDPDDAGRRDVPRRRDFDKIAPDGFPDRRHAGGPDVPARDRSGQPADRACLGQRPRA